jgi:hypothetical protein
MQATRTAVPNPGDEHRSRVRHLNQIELARRWRISPRTLERWRWRSQGPRYLKMGGRVVYRCDDVEAFEAAQAREPLGEPARLAAAGTSPRGG